MTNRHEDHAHYAEADLTEPGPVTEPMEES